MTTADASASPIQVRFALELSGRGMLDEDDAALQQRPATRFTPSGVMGEIRFGAGDSEVAIQDDVTNLAWSLCLDAIPIIRVGGRYAMRFYERRGVVLWEPDGDNVVLVVDNAPRGRYPRAAITEAMLACMERLGRCFCRLGVHDDIETQGAAAAILDRIAELEVGRAGKRCA